MSAPAPHVDVARTHASEVLPRKVLIAAGLLIGAAIAMTGFARFTGVGTTAQVRGAPVSTLELHFSDRDDGGIAVTTVGGDKAAPTRQDQVIQPGGDGFLRATVRGLVRERRRAGIGPEAPFLLTRWSDGTLSLSDPTTSRSVSLEAFGPTNAQAFARLFTPGAQP
jgi:putative photosynthetic complex assembly protein